NVHTVDVIGAEDDHVVRIGLLDQIDVLMQRVGSASIPILAGGSHLGGYRNDEVLLQEAADFPAFAQVLQQALTLELDQHIDGIDAGIHQVAENEIDDAIASAERDRRLGSFLSQGIEPCTFSSGQYKR